MEINGAEQGTAVPPEDSRPADLVPPFTERRHEQRTMVSRVIYLNMGAENGGVVTDVCSNGLGIRAARPMDATSNVSFTLMADGSRLRGSAAVVWMDQGKRSCGLRFTSLAPPLRLHINRLIGHAQSAPLDSTEPALTMPEPGLPMPEPTPAEAATSESKAEGPAALDTSRFNASLPNTFLLDDWIKQENDVSRIRSRAFGGGVVAGLLLAGLIAGLVGLAAVMHNAPSSQARATAQTQEAAHAQASKPAAFASSPAPAPPADSSALISELPALPLSPPVASTQLSLPSAETESRSPAGFPAVASPPRPLVNSASRSGKVRQATHVQRSSPRASAKTSGRGRHVSARLKHRPSPARQHSRVSQARASIGSSNP